MPRELVYFGEGKQALAAEVRHHPDMKEGLSHYSTDQFIERLGVAAAYVGIVIDGYYNAEQLDQLCGLVCLQLKKKRAIVINSPIDLH